MSNLIRTGLLIVVGLPLLVGCAASRRIASRERTTPLTTPSEQPIETPTETLAETLADETPFSDVVPVSHAIEAVEDIEAVTSEGNAPAEWVPSTTPAALSLEDIEVLAMEHNPAIRQAMYAVSKAAGVRTQVGLKPNPTVGYFGQEIGNEGAGGLHGAFFSQTFVRGDKLEWNRAVIDRDVQSLLWETEAQRYRVRTDLRLSFYDALAAQRRLTLAHDFHIVAAKGVGIAEERLKALEGAKPDVLQAEIQLGEVDLIVQRAELEFDAAWNSLVTIAGVPHLPPSELLGTLSSTQEGYDTELVYHELLAASPQLQAARARVDRARANINRQSVQAIPNLTARLGAGYDDSTGDEFANVQLSVPLPVHNKNQGNQRAAQAEYCRATQEVRRLELALRAQLLQVMRDYRVSRVSIERYENTMLPKSQESLDLSEQAYLIGEFDFLRVLTVRRTFFETNLQYVQSLASAAKAEARIEGLLLSGGLNTVPDFQGGGSLRGQALNGR